MVGAFRSGALLVLLGLTLAVGSGCSTSSEEDDVDSKDDDFAVLPVDSLSSILPSIEDSEGQPDVCIGLIGFDSDAEQKAAFDRVTKQITDSANAWNRLLEGNELWKLRGAIKPSFSMQSSECADINYAGFNVNLWKTADAFKKEHCGKNRTPDDRCASSASPRRRTFFLGPWNRTKADDPLDGFTVLHEYGHLLGLGDTYKMPGLHDFEGEQPDSVMNGRSRTLTDDDKLGLWATLRAVKTGIRSCEGFGEKAELTANGFKAILCNPKSAPVTQHEGRPNDGDAIQPPAGPIPESTLDEIDTYEVASLEMNCRQDAGTEHPVVHRVKRGTPVKALGGPRRIAYSTQEKPWLLVNLEGRTCYASASFSFLKPVGAIPTSTLQEVNRYAVASDLLNCRAGAGTEHAIVQKLTLGARMVAEAGTAARPRIAQSTEGNPWILVRANGQPCYASANFKFIAPQE